LYGLGFMSGYGRRLQELEALADGKKSKTRWCGGGWVVLTRLGRVVDIY